MKIKSMAELEDAVAEIGRLQSTRDQITAGVEEKIDRLKEELRSELESGDFDGEIERITVAVSYYVAENRSTLFKADSKTAKVLTGEIQIRKKPDSVSTRSSAKWIEKILDNHSMSSSVARLRERLNKIFLRIKIEPDKEAMLKDRKTAKEKTGVQFAIGEEEVFVKPAEVHASPNL